MPSVFDPTRKSLRGIILIVRLWVNQIRVGYMQTRLYIEKLLFPGFASNVRRRNMRFLLLAVLLGVFVSVAFGAILYLLNSQGRIS